MKKLALAGVALAAVAFAAVPGNKIGVVQGANIRCFTTNDGGAYSTGRTGLDLDIQCPNVDGGSGQKVYIRAGCALKADGGGSCVMDAGVGDIILDFTSSTGQQDPFHYKLGTAEDRFCLASVNGYSDAVLCHVYERRP